MILLIGVLSTNNSLLKIAGAVFSIKRIHSFTPLQGFTPLSPFRDSLLPVVHPNRVIQYNHENPK